MADELWFDGAVGDDLEAVAFARSLNALASAARWPVDPEGVWVQWLGACLYVAVDTAFDGVQLEICYWPAGSPRGRGLETGWGDSAHPLDAQIEVRGGRIAVRDDELAPAGFAEIAFAWVREQLARPLEVHRWNQAKASRIVLADSGEVLSTKGLRVPRGEPDVRERL